MRKMAKSKITFQLMAGLAAQLRRLVSPPKSVYQDLKKIECTITTYCKMNQIGGGGLGTLPSTMSLGGAGFGFGWPSPSLPKLLAEDAGIPITSAESSWIVSVFTIGAAVGSLVGALLVDRWGRKWLLLSTIIPHLISCILISSAQDFWWFIIARIISGLGTGMAYPVVTMYTGEIADERIRGAVSGMLDPTVNVLVVVTYCVGPWVSIQTLALVGGVFPIIFGLMFVWMPESPYFLIMKHDLEQAKQSLSWLRGKSDVDEELLSIQENVESEQKNAGTIMDLVMIPGNRKALIIVLGMMAAQQFSGISAIVAYSSLIFEEAGSTWDSSICVIILGVCQLLAGVLTVFLADLAGRRLLMSVSVVGSVLNLVGIALYFHLRAIGIDVSPVSWLPVVLTFAFIVICTIGMGALPYVVLSEIFPCSVKAWATTIANVGASLLAVVATKLYQIIGDAHGIYVSFWAFTGLTLLMGIVMHSILPETKQRSLRDIQNELHKPTESRVALEKSNIA